MTPDPLVEAIRFRVLGVPAPQGSKTRMPNGALLEAGSQTGRQKVSNEQIVDAYKPLYSTREYAERLRAAAEQGASWPAPESAGQALVVADLLCPLFTTAPSIALAKLADAYRMSARIAWRWDPTTGEFRDPTTGEFR